MTKEGAKEFIERMKNKHGDKYREEMGKMAECNPEEFDDYGMTYILFGQTTSKKMREIRAKRMKGHGEELFPETRVETENVRKKDWRARRAERKGTNVDQEKLRQMFSRNWEQAKDETEEK